MQFSRNFIAQTAGKIFISFVSGSLFRENRNISAVQSRDRTSSLLPKPMFLRNIRRPWNGMTLLEEPRGRANFWQFSNYWNILPPKTMAFQLCPIRRISPQDLRLPVPDRIKARFFRCPWEFDLLYRNIGTSRSLCYSRKAHRKYKLRKISTCKNSTKFFDEIKFVSIHRRL